jgi:hypothetical protein
MLAVVAVATPGAMAAVVPAAIEAESVPPAIAVLDAVPAAVTAPLMPAPALIALNMELIEAAIAVMVRGHIMA